jgi:hypothetical protein
MAAQLSRPMDCVAKIRLRMGLKRREDAANMRLWSPAVMRVFEMSQSPSPTARILVVEDDESYRLLLRRILSGLLIRRTPTTRRPPASCAAAAVVRKAAAANAAKRSRRPFMRSPGRAFGDRDRHANPPRWVAVLRHKWQVPHRERAEQYARRLTRSPRLRGKPTGSRPQYRVRAPPRG